MKPTKSKRVLLQCPNGCPPFAAETPYAGVCPSCGSPYLDFASRIVAPPPMVLLCLHPSCYGEFYLPLEIDEAKVCLNDREHPVAVYEVIHG